MSSSKLSCPNCSFVAKNAGGLTSHARKHQREQSQAPKQAARETLIPMEMPKPKVTKAQASPDHQVKSVGVCRSCHVLPVGSVELVSLLLVLIFSLTAVLLTSVYALEIQGAQISELEARMEI